MRYFWILLAFSLRAHAFLLDTNTFYFTDTFVPANANTSFAYTNYDVRFGFAVDKKSRFFAGWNYSGNTATSTVSATSTSTQYSSSEMGPSFLYVINKDKSWILSFSYNLVSTATYSTTGATAVKWKGTTMKAYLGYNIEVSDDLFFGPTITYYSATFNEQIINGTTYSTTANTRTQIYPALYFGYRY